MTIKMNILSAFDDSGVKKAQASLKNLAKSQIGLSLSLAGLAQVTKTVVQAYSQDQASQKQLAIALTNTTGASANQIAMVEKNVAVMEKQFAVADDQLRPALASLSRVTKSVAISQDLLKVSMDISAATGKDLETVALAVGRAYQGNIGALRRLGLAISDGAIKNKDFGAALDEVKTLTDGAAQALADSTEGSWKKFSIAVGNLAEELGKQLAPTLATVADGVAGLTAQLTSSADESERYWGVVQLLKDGWNALKDPIGYLNGEYLNFASTTEMVSNSQAGLFRMFESGKLPWNTTKKNIDGTKDKANELKKKLDDLARTTRNELANALQNAKDKVQSIKDSMAAYASSIGDAVRGYASLTNAVNSATNNETDYQDALKERASAYAELNALEEERRKRGFAINDQVTYDADAYASAMKRVADAEGQVNSTQAKQRNYSAIFAGQVAAAKSFANNLKALANAGLGTNGLQQLLDLGPVAGAQVASDLLAGVGGLTISGLNADLGALQTAGTELGNLMAPGIYGADLANAQTDVNLLGQASVRRGTTNVTIQVNGGDPNAVVAALRRYMQLNGSVPIKVSG